MAQQQQTVLQVKTNIPDQLTSPAVSNIAITGTTTGTYTGSGTTTNPYLFTGATSVFGSEINVDFVVTGNSIFNYTINTSYNPADTPYFDFNYTDISITHANGYNSKISGFKEWQVNNISGNFVVQSGDRIFIVSRNGQSLSSITATFFITPNEELNNPVITTFDTLDLYTDIPIKITKSFAELQDISKRNSDLSIGLQLPGSKKNNRFFENFYNVDQQTLFFDITRRVECDVLIDDQSYFKGYLKLNKVSVINSKVEYDVTLYSTVADITAKMGNNLLKDLDYNDIDFHFNHYFNLWNAIQYNEGEPLANLTSVPTLWLYPTIHNGYLYSGDTVNFTGGTPNDQSRLFTSTSVGYYTNYAAFTAAGGKEFRINSPRKPILDNQLKPALNVWGLIQLMFKTYGYTIKSDFFQTPWFKLLYTYGYFSNDGTKFSYKTPVPQVLTLEGVEVVLETSVQTSYQFACSQWYQKDDTTITAYVVKQGTGIPCLCSDSISLVFDLESIPCFGSNSVYQAAINIAPLSTGGTLTYTSLQYSDCGFGCPYQPEYINNLGINPTYSNIDGASSIPLAYLPQTPNQIVNFEDDDYVDFSLVIDENIKQIDFLSSIAKKFNLIFVQDPQVPNQIIIEPYDYYVGTGEVKDWSNKLSWDKGFTVEPALNYVESELYFSDLEDGDDGNKQFKDKNNRLYGENRIYNPTDFKSQVKKIETIFSPEIVRVWDANIGLPLGINYAGTTEAQSSGDSEKVSYFYKGLKSKLKLFYFVNNVSPFIDKVGEVFSIPYSGITNAVPTWAFRTALSDGTNPGGTTNAIGQYTSAIISHTFPLGNSDANKINNDSICVLFNSEQPQDIGIGIPTFNTYTNNDVYNLFYYNRINNIYNKNTRFLSGNFNLNLYDILSLKANDIIKINEQYFVWNKVTEFDVTNPELTKVELIQTKNHKENTE